MRFMYIVRFNISWQVFWEIISNTIIFTNVMLSWFNNCKISIYLNLRLPIKFIRDFYHLTRWSLIQFFFFHICSYVYYSIFWHHELTHLFVWIIRIKWHNVVKSYFKFPVRVDLVVADQVHVPPTLKNEIKLNNIQII